jgi:hypothetical protein
MIGELFGASQFILASNQSPNPAQVSSVEQQKNRSLGHPSEKPEVLLCQMFVSAEALLSNQSSYRADLD